MSSPLVWIICICYNFVIGGVVFQLAQTYNNVNEHLRKHHSAMVEDPGSSSKNRSSTSTCAKACEVHDDVLAKAYYWVFSQKKVCSLSFSKGFSSLSLPHKFSITLVFINQLTNSNEIYLSNGVWRLW